MAEEKKLGLFALIALVIGSMIGGGAFNLASDMASGAGAGAILIGWIITGVGMIALAFSFQNLTTKRPDLDGGIFTFKRFVKIARRLEVTVYRFVSRCSLFKGGILFIQNERIVVCQRD